MAADDLPLETLHNVFQYLEALDCLQGRHVCRKWRDIAAGCASLRLTNSGQGRTVVIWNGLVRFMKYNPGVIMAGEKNDSDGEEASSLSLEVPLEVVECGPCSAALRLERSGQQDQAWKRLDLAKSSILVMYQQGEFRRFRPGDPYWSLQMRLQDVDLSNLAWLERLSVLDCVRLKTLSLPSSLEELNAEGCSSLVRILVPFGMKKLQSVILTSCSSLDDVGLLGEGSAGIMSSILNIDFSNCASPAVTGALKMTQNLEELHLEGIATDYMIKTLLQSKSFGKMLRKLDLSNSPEVSDRSVASLVKNAPNLEHIKLLACSSVSDVCRLRIRTELDRKCSSRFAPTNGTSSPAENRKRKIEEAR
jgi:hypothetical protein